MNTDNIPPELLYNFVRPKGFSSEYFEWIVNPMGGQSIIQPSEILRYQLNLTDGFFDPYRSYFEIEVATDIPMGLLQVDNSAFGFISQSLIINNSAEIERISEYDQVGAILTSLGYPEVFAAGRDYEGLGRSYFMNQAKVSNVATSSQSVGLQNRWNAQSTMITSIGDISGTQLNPLLLNANQSTFGGGRIESYGQGWSDPINGSVTPVTKHNISKWNKSEKMEEGLESEIFAKQGLVFLPPDTLGMSPSIVSQMNCELLASDNPQNNKWWTQAETANNGLTVPRAEYSLSSASLRYVDTKDTILRNVMRGATNIRNFDPVNPNVKYDVEFSDNIGCHYVDYGEKDGQGNYRGSDAFVTQPNTCAVNGFQQPYSPELSIGCDEPFISPTIPQCSMLNGRITNKPMPVRTKRFIVPFLSAVMGIQIPKEAYALLPLKAFYNTIIELTLNKYGMFSSGFNDRNIFDSSGMMYPINRNFYFTKFNYVLQVYNFNDNGIKEYMESSLSRGIVFTTEIVNLTSTYMVANQLSLRGTWTVNTTAGSISHVIVRFLDNRYLQYPFLRKQYSLSCNISSFQIKFDTKWFPPQPIVGNAGNPEYLDTTGNVQPYLNLLYMSSDWLFNQKPMPIVNPLNFAINSRVFDPSNTAPYIRGGWKPFTTLPSDWVNCDTAMGFPHFHENRCVGRGLYVYSFEPQGHSMGLVNGLNSGRSRPFEIILNTSVKDPNPNEIGMYVFIKSHQIVAISKNGVRTQDLGEY